MMFLRFILSVVVWAADAYGFRLSEVEAGSVFAKAGLRVGDVVLSFDGEPVRAAAEMDRLPSILSRARRVVIRVERDGKVIILRYRLLTVEGRG